ncbi:Rgg family transcriptional regulator [Vagococcus fluvialis]|uniref:RopB Rgg-like transcription regulator n=1 Tax=Vagococcus fluvialis bH819 TaxID=1255619 RepID=A0A1X6WNY7_9ENTE|nr:hypothetical protein [Vagococcus fluvialis]SLM85990.1 RopB; Rgg-like transcription regulator [Vagococcus fluvialis bH819]
MNVSYTEFFYLVEIEGEPFLNKELKEIKLCFENKNIDKLKSLSYEYECLFNSYQILKFSHLSLIALSLSNRIQNKIDKEATLKIKKYLLNVNEWGHYEFALFNNLFFLFENDDINLLIKQCVRTATKYENYDQISQEFIMLMSNLLIHYFSTNQLSSAFSLINSLSKLKIKPENILEKTIVKFWCLLQEYLITEQEDVKNEIEKLLNYLSLIDAKELKRSLRGIFSDVIK